MFGFWINLNYLVYLLNNTLSNLHTDLFEPVKSTLFLGKTLHFLPVCESTNSWAYQNCLQSDQAIEGNIFICNHQTKGRGQQAAVWESGIGKNLTFSLVLKPKKTLSKHLFWLGAAIALGVRDYLEKELVTQKALVKWPNDVLIDAKKVSGILIENNFRGSRLQFSVVGIGLNVNQVDGLPEHAASLTRFTGKTYDLQEQLESLLTFVEGKYLDLEQNGWEKIREKYLEYLHMHGRKRNFETPEGRAFSGAIETVNDEGKIAILAQERLQWFGLKEIIFK